MHPSPANHPCLVCGRATSRCQPVWYRAAEHPTADADARSNVPAEGTSTRSEQLKPPHDRSAPGARAVRTVEPPLTAQIDGDNGSTSGDTAGGTSNTVIINGSAPMPFDRDIISHGGQGGNGGEGGGTGGNGGTGEGNQLQIHLASETTLNVYYGGRNRDLEFVVDMVVCLAWLGLSALALACLHRLGWFDIGENFERGWQKIFDRTEIKY
ncbi:hypothetical protein C8R44DRAFT_741088 [Mycena epipterygia]|nr:hypothetical protein C8R44DRAFT_741088 [Mycena epipterygia]